MTLSVNRMEDHVTALAKILADIGEQVEGNFICDYAPHNDVRGHNSDKIHNLQTLVRGKTRVCEVGFNAGHSLLLMIDVNPTAEYVLFDIGIHAYTRPCFEYLRAAYPSTSMTIIYGDSKETLPAYQGSFDLIHIDGGHLLPELTSDYTQSLRLIQPGCPIVFDDTDYPTIATFLNAKLAAGEVRQHTETPGLKSTGRHLILTRD
jgi:predicted O-methyltransferase YrrM